METGQLQNPQSPPDGSEPKSRPRDLPHKACDSCKRRKVRCSGTSPCDHCRRNQSTCSYSSRHGRLAYLERRLQQSEKHIRTLETAWKGYLPDVDLAQALEAVESRPPSSSSLQPSVDPGTREKVASRDSTTPELEADAADTLEWDETLELTAATDGIGSLSVHNSVSGYMGPQSGNALLKYLQSIGNFLSGDTTDPESAPLSVSSTNPPELQDRLNSSESRKRCLDWYFQYFHPAYPFLHEGFFRAQCMGAVSKPKDGSWPVLYNMVLAVGAFAGPESASGADAHFHTQAHAAMSVELLHKGSLTLVQAFALMANYLQKRNKPNSGFTFLGVALNIAQGLGLHREFAESSMSAFTMEMRRRVWWTLFIFDSGARLTFGRSSILLGSNVRAPRNLDDADLAVDDDCLEDFKEYPTITSSLIWQSKLAEISNEANAKLLERRLPREHAAVSLHNSIMSWWDKLPVYLKEDPEDRYSWFEIPRMVLLWRSQHLRIVITRPFLLDVLRNRRVLDISDPKGAVGLCLSASHDCTQSIIAFCADRQSFSGSLTWYATYWLVTAVFVTVTCLMYDPYHESAQVWRVQVEQAKATLGILATVEPIASRAARILSMIMDLVPPSPSMDTIAVNEPMRMGIADIWSESWLQVDQMTMDMMQPSIVGTHPS